MKLGLRELIFVLLLAAVPLGAWWFVFRPRNVRDGAMLRQIEAQQARLQQLNKTTGAVGDMQREIDSLEKGIAFLQTKLPSEKEIDKVVQEVCRLAEASQLAVKSFHTKARTAEPVFVQAGGANAEQPIEMKLEGNYLGFYSFLLALENQPRVMRIRKLLLTRPEKMALGCVQANFEMTVFFERSDKDKDKK